MDGLLGDIGALEARRLIATCPATAHIPVVRLAPGRPLPRRVLSILQHGHA